VPGAKSVGIGEKGCVSVLVDCASEIGPLPNRALLLQIEIPFGWPRERQLFNRADGIFFYFIECPTAIENAGISYTTEKVQEIPVDIMYHYIPDYKMLAFFESRRISVHSFCI
jgi:hypothetical protein